MTDYGQRPAMEDPSMVGTLVAQAEMIWPLERLLLERLGLPRHPRILDLGCGTGEIASRIAEAWPDLEVTGVDLYAGHVRLARDRHPPDRYPRLHFEVGDGYSLERDDAAFDAVLIRHLLHAVPDTEGLLREARRVLAPGGLLYVLAEDYAGLLFDSPEVASRDLFRVAHGGLLQRGTDLHHGRRAYRELRRMGFHDVRVDPIVVDTCNTPRDVFARMLRFWRDGYAALIAEVTGLGDDDVRGRFDALVRTVEDEDRYAAWLLFAASGRKAGSPG